MKSSSEPAVTAQESWRERANAELQKIVTLFATRSLPDLCAKALINAPEKPSSRWSLGNQILMFLAGTSDARGYAQWQEVGRHVRPGAKSFRILGPVLVKKQVGNASPDESEEETVSRILVGFRTIPVFRFEDTEGTDLPTYAPRNPPPLLEVATRFGTRVTYERLASGVYGVTDYTTKTIILASDDDDVFFHELAHAIHRSFEPKAGHGQEPEAEAIAQLVAATLARVYDKPVDGFSWNYISMVAGSSNPQMVGKLCMRVLERTKRTLDLIYRTN